MNADEIVKELRACAKICNSAACHVAIDLIESLQAQLKDVTATLEQTWEWDMYRCANREIDRLRRDLAASQRREKAAVKDIMCCDHCDVCLFGKEHDGECKKADYDCLTCKSATCACRECRNEDHWQWRGPEAGKGADNGKV